MPKGCAHPSAIREQFEDPLLTLLAEHRFHEQQALAARERADEAFFALPRQRRDRGERHPLHAMLEREALALEAVEARLWRRINRTAPRTLAGAIAQLEMLQPFYQESIIAAVIRGLREMDKMDKAPPKRRAA